MALEESAVAPQSVPSLPRRLWRWFWRGLLAVLLLLVLALAGALAALRNADVQAWLSGRINAVLASSLQDSGLSARLTNLSGAVPFSFSFGLELGDEHGLWCSAPDNSFAWDWRALPGTLRISHLRSRNPVLFRLPDLPPQAEPEPAAPLTEESLRAALGDAVRAWESLPTWLAALLPDVRLENLALENALLPQSLLSATQGGTVSAPSAAADSPGAGSAKEPAAAGLRADLKTELRADSAGADLRLYAALAGAGGRVFALPGLDCDGLDLYLDAWLRPQRKNGQTALASQSRLSVRLRPAVAPVAAVDPDGSGGESAQSPLAAMLGSEARLDLELVAGATAPATGGASTAHLALNKLDLAARRLELKGRAVWQSGSGDWLSGPLDMALRLNLAPAQSAPKSAQAGQDAAATPGRAADPLDMLRAPAMLTLTVKGPLAAPDLRLNLACADAQSGGHQLSQANLAITAAPLDWLWLLDGPAPTSAQAPLVRPTPAGTDVTRGVATNATIGAEPAVQAVLDLQARLDERPLSLTARLFAGPEADVGPNFGSNSIPGPGKALRAGVRDLRLSAVGLEGSGQAAAILVPGLPPALDGRLDLRVADWSALSAIVPDARLDGDAALSLELRSKSDADPAPDSAVDPAGQPSQEAVLRWHVPRLSYSGANGENSLHVRGLEGQARLTDLFGRAAVDAHLDMAGLSRADLSLAAHARAQGPLDGPLDATLETSGALAAHLQAQWRPGQVDLRRLDARLPRYKLGLRAAPGAVLRYGQGGLGVSGLDLTLEPSGKLRVQGVLSPDKLDLRAGLERLALGPWRTLVPALPQGTLEARARLDGSPALPGGDFRLGLRGLRLPNSALAPLDLALAGTVERGTAVNGGSALAVRLELDPKTIKALGGSEARLNARLPLLFGSDGLPRPALQERLQGQVRWDGAVGPLWSLLPIADRRLSGQVALSVDLGGTLAAPRLRGFVRVDKARYEDLPLGVLLTDMNLRLTLEQEQGAAGSQADANGKSGAASALPGAARLEFSAADGLGGSVRLAGRSNLDGGHLDLRASLDHLRPLRRRDLRIDLSGQAQVTGSALAPDVRGEIIINQGALLLNKLDVGGSITTLPITAAPDKAQKSAAKTALAQAGTAKSAKAAKSVKSAKSAGAEPDSKVRQAQGHSQAAKAGEAPAGLLDLRIRAPGHFVVEGYGLTSEWKADLLVGGTVTAPVITGQLSALKGNFDFLTKDFKLSRGVITFGGGALSNPLLDIVLSNQSQDLLASVAISGTVRTMKLTLSSVPELPKEEILSRMLFGRSANELGRLENLRLAGAVAQLAGFGSGGAGVFDFARKTLDVDVLRLDSGGGSGSQGEGEGDLSAGGTRLEMGKYITDMIYVGVQQGMKPDSTAFIIQMELTPRLNLELHTEQQDTWGGLSWKYDY